MDSFKILEYIKKRDRIVNECYDNVEEFVDEESNEIVFVGNGNLNTNLVAEKTIEINRDFSKYSIGKYVCKLNKDRVNLSLFYLITDIIYYDNQRYPLCVLKKVSNYLKISKTPSSQVIFTGEFHFIELEEIKSIVGYVESKKIPFESRSLYVLRNELGRYKIGVATNVDKRVRALSIATGSKIEIIFEFPESGSHETRLHKIFKEKRYLGEWFNLDYSDLQKISSLNLKKY